MTASLTNFDFTPVNFDTASMTVPMGTFDYGDEVRVTVSLEIFNAQTAEVQLHIIDCDVGLDYLSDDDRFVAQLEQHLTDILRAQVKLLHNENIEADTMLFDLV